MGQKNVYRERIQAAIRAYSYHQFVVKWQMLLNELLIKKERDLLIICDQGKNVGAVHIRILAPTFREPFNFFLVHINIGNVDKLSCHPLKLTAVHGIIYYRSLPGHFIKQISK